MEWDTTTACHIGGDGEPTELYWLRLSEQEARAVVAVVLADYQYEYPIRLSYSNLTGQKGRHREGRDLYGFLSYDEITVHRAGENLGLVLHEVAHLNMERLQIAADKDPPPMFLPFADTFPWDDPGEMFQRRQADLVAEWEARLGLWTDRAWRGLKRRPRGYRAIEEKERAAALLRLRALLLHAPASGGADSG